MLAGVLALAALALLSQATAHTPTPGFPGEAEGNTVVVAPIPSFPTCWAVSPTSGLNGVTFVGPPGTCIESVPCPGIADVDIPFYGNPGNQHIGHIQQVVAVGGNTLAPSSVDLWHFSAMDQPPGTVENPNSVTGGSTQSVMMGADGFFRGQFATPVQENTVPGSSEITLTDVHPKRSYCIYGSLSPSGPFIFITATWGAPGAVTNVDISDWYRPLFMYTHPGEVNADGSPNVRVSYFMMIASGFVYVPPPNVLVDPCVYLDPVFDGGYDMAPGVMLSASAVPATGGFTYTWDFGDGSPPVTGQTVNHVYLDDGDFTVTVTGSVSWYTDTATTTCRMYNRAPVAEFECSDVMSGAATSYSGYLSSDPEGPIATYIWDFGDGTGLDYGLVVEHTFPYHNLWTITLTVQDADHGMPGVTNYITEDTTTLDCWSPNTPPRLQPPPRPVVPSGTMVRYTVTGYDPDGDSPLVLSSRNLPYGATFDPATGAFEWRAGRAGIYEGFFFRITDPYGAYDERAGYILVYDEASDVDLDGVPDRADNCPSTANHGQGDSDRDGTGDACVDEATDAAREGSDAQGTPHLPGADRPSWAATDSDLDGVIDLADNCPTRANREQRDFDGDGLGDVCDGDLDGDGVPNEASGSQPGDNCPLMPNPEQTDRDGNGSGDLCDGHAAGLQGSPGDMGARSPQPVRQADGMEAKASTGWTSLAAPAGLGLLALLATCAAVFGLLWRRLGD